jgi:hypothetical protein
VTSVWRRLPVTLGWRQLLLLLLTAWLLLLLLLTALLLLLPLLTALLLLLLPELLLPDLAGAMAVQLFFGMMMRL